MGVLISQMSPASASAKMLKQKVATLLVVAVILVATCAEGLHPEPRIESSSGSSRQSSKSSMLFKSEKISNNKKQIAGDYDNISTDTYDYADNNNASNDIKQDIDRIQVSDTSKMLLQTSLRFALAQSGVTRYVDLETAMDVVSDTGFMLSKPSNLAKATKVVVIALATLMTSAFLFPNAYKFIDAILKDPSKQLRVEKYLSNGIYDKSILNLVGAKVDELLARVGMDDSACQELTVCQSAKALRCAFPQSTNGLARLFADNYTRPRYRQNKFVNAFYSGFVDRNCTSETKNTKQNCMGALVYGYLYPTNECFNEQNPRSFSRKK